MVVVLTVLVISLTSGCEQEALQREKTSLPLRPVFYPGLPEKPRIQFLTSFSGTEFITKPEYSSMDKFLFGEPESDKVNVDQGVKKPYGVAIYDGKIYVCDVAKRMVEVIDITNKKFGYLTKDRRLSNPVNIYIDQDGQKYITDSGMGKIFVFDKSDRMVAIWGTDIEFRPADIFIREQRCYVTDVQHQQVVVLDKVTGKEIFRMGGRGKEKDEGRFTLISGLALDQQENIYVTDKVLARITKFNKEGIFQETIGQRSQNIHDFFRPKGISIDKENRIWVVDAGPEVAKIYDPQGRLLLYFGAPGTGRGSLVLPADICLDYDNVDLFKDYAVEGAELDFIILISSQYGPNKINVYGFGSFPAKNEQLSPESKIQQ